MREPLFTPSSEAARIATPPHAIWTPGEAAALYRSITLAIESAFRFGKDLPVGAVALKGDAIVGRGFAGDTRLGVSYLHAERMAILDATIESMLGENPDTLVVSLEPCDDCQDFLAEQPGLKRVAYGLSRADAASLGLVKPHDEDISERKELAGLPYEVVQVDDANLRRAGFVVLEAARRDLDSSIVTINALQLTQELTRLNAE